MLSCEKKDRNGTKTVQKMVSSPKRFADGHRKVAGLTPLEPGWYPDSPDLSRFAQGAE
jgi:hypothetical protein